MAEKAKDKVHCFYIEEAEKYGVEKASILYNLRFWLDKELAKATVGKGKGTFKHTDGKIYAWTFNSSREFAILLPYLKERSISRWLDELERDGRIISNVFNRSPYDRTKWYTMPEYEIKNQVRNTISQNGKSAGQNSESIPQDGEPIPNINSIINMDTNYILSDDNIYEDSSLKEIENTEKEVSNFSQLKKRKLTKNPEPSVIQPSTAEDRKWFKEYFCETFSLYTINEVTGEKIYSTPEPEVVQNIKIKEFMDANTRQTAEAKVGWFKRFCRTKQGKWIKNITFNVFIQQLPNYIEAKLDMERILAKKEKEKKELEETERKREEIERKMKEEQKAILIAEANYKADLKNALDAFQKLNDEAKVDFFFDNVKDKNFRFYRNENDFFVLLPEMAKVLVYYFDSKEEYWKQMSEYREDIEKFYNLTPRERIKLFYDKTNRTDCLQELYITIVPEELREEVKNYSDFNEFIMWRWNEEKVKELTKKETEF
jgi:hypothetical protein